MICAVLCGNRPEYLMTCCVCVGVRERGPPDRIDPHPKRIETNKSKKEIKFIEADSWAACQKRVWCSCFLAFHSKSSPSLWFWEGHSSSGMSVFYSQIDNYLVATNEHGFWLIMTRLDSFEFQPHPSSLSYSWPLSQSWTSLWLMENAPHSILDFLAISLPCLKSGMCFRFRP